MDPDILASQKKQELIGAFWPRKVSPYITRILVRTPITPNQTTVLWGVVSVLNCYTVYLSMTGRWWAIPLIPVIFQFAFVLDCVDGEIARYKNTVNPIGGKLLDGVCHRATEFALIVTFAVAGHVATGSMVALLAGLLMLAGDGMWVYVYERRLTALRVQAGFKGHIKEESPDGVYQRGMRWRDLTPKQQRLSIVELVHYKSIYAVVAISYLPPRLFLAGLIALALYKHWKWIRLLRDALGQVSRLTADAAAPRDATQPQPDAAKTTVRSWRG